MLTMNDKAALQAPDGRIADAYLDKALAPRLIEC
jgi:hypothetical protein